MEKFASVWRRRLGSMARVVVVLSGLVALDSQAGVDALDPGDIPELRPDEGLFLVGVDSTIDLDSVRFSRDGHLFGGGSLRQISKGQTAELYVATAGEYQWSSISAFGRVRYDLKDDPEYRFNIKPGRITYAGDLIFRPTGFYSAGIHISNRGLRAIDWLEAHHPEVARAHAFTYAGHYPDPFPEFYRQARRDPPRLAEELNVVREPPPAPDDLALAIRDLWSEARVQGTALNASGDLLVLKVREEDDNDEERWALDLVDLKAGEMTRIATSPAPFASVQWAGDRVLVAGVGSAAAQMVSVVRIGARNADSAPFTVLRMRDAGRVLDPLPRDPDAILFASIGSRDDLMVHRVDISNQATLDAFTSKARKRLNRGVNDDFNWLADGNGRLRAALAERDDAYVLMHGDRESFTEVLRLQADGGFEPLALSHDGNLIYGLSDEGRAQRDLVVFDPAERRVTRTLFSKPGVDVVSPLFDSARTPIGATYYMGGRLVSEYFAEQRQALTELLEAAFPDRTVTVIERSLDSMQLVLWVDGSDQPPLLYHLDVGERRASLLAAAQPWLDGKSFVASQLIRVAGQDGLTIEAYLTLPPSRGKRPLVVLPHGGPVGVSDDLHFDPRVQFLASLGYAVLQVNFRGSAGYGKAFRTAGHGGHGTLIEDDIDAALQHVLAHHPVDPTRMCMVGSSYGGYSALVSIVRWPQRFRCAVSISGVSDQVLFFTASDGGRSAEGREQLERIIGDPNTQQAEMIASSPLYRYADMQVPVMLVHGEKDVRVDYEHTRRMIRMLNLAGRPPVVLTFDDEGHGAWDIDNLAATWSGIAGFLQAHMGRQPAPPRLHSNN